MKKPAKKTAKPKPNRGKQHPLHAESLDHLADACEGVAYFTMASVFRAEAKRVRKILR